MENEEYKRVLTGGDYTIVITNNDEGFNYEVKKGNDLLWSGGEHSTYEETIIELSMIHEALKAIFG